MSDFKFTFNGLLNDLANTGNDTTYFKTLWDRYDVTERIEAFILDLNDAGLVNDEGHEKMNDYLAIIGLIIEGRMEDELITEYCKRINRAVSNRFIKEWAGKAAHIIVTKADDALHFEGVDAKIAWDALSAVCAFLGNNAIKDFEPVL